MIQYKVIPRKNPQTKNEKFYPQLLPSLPVDLNRIAADIEKISSLSRGDIKNVLDNLQHVVINHLRDGRSVRLGELGSLRLSLRSSGSLSKEDVTAANIRSVAVIYNPAKEIREALKPTNLQIQKAPEVKP